MLARFSTAIRTILGQPKTIGILGLGIEGRSSYKIVRTLYPEASVILLDKNSDLQMPKHPLTTLSVGDGYLGSIALCDVVFRSPGIKLTAEDYLGRVVSQSSLFTLVCREQIIGVTGTKGKSTTTTLIHHLLSSSYKTALVGNIGIPPLEALTEDYDYYVCEYSCHQLSDMEVSPKYSLLLNLFPEHLDYYTSVEEYYATKRNIHFYQEATDKHYSISSTNSPGTALELNKNFTIASHTLLATSKTLQIDDHKVPYAATLAGDHNKLNQLFAVAVALELGLTYEHIARQLTSFVGLAHRLETIYEEAGLRYVNDSISTIPQSTLAAVASYSDVTSLLIGGFDRGIDYSPLVNYLERALELEVVLFSEVGKRIGQSLKRPCIYKKTFAEAIQHTLDQRPKSGTVLMSPGASSYDEFSSFVHRGEAYRKQITDYFKALSKN